MFTVITLHEDYSNQPIVHQFSQNVQPNSSLHTRFTLISNSLIVVGSALSPKNKKVYWPQILRLWRLIDVAFSQNNANLNKLMVALAVVGNLGHPGEITRLPDHVRQQLEMSQPSNISL